MNVRAVGQRLAGVEDLCDGTGALDGLETKVISQNCHHPNVFSAVSIIYRKLSSRL
jgi:hypothetical protein